MCASSNTIETSEELPRTYQCVVCFESCLIGQFKFCVKCNNGVCLKCYKQQQVSTCPYCRGNMNDEVIRVRECERCGKTIDPPVPCNGRRMNGKLYCRDCTILCNECPGGVNIVPLCPEQINYMLYFKTIGIQLCYEHLLIPECMDREIRIIISNYLYVYRNALSQEYLHALSVLWIPKEYTNKFKIAVFEQGTEFDEMS